MTGRALGQRWTFPSPSPRSWPLHRPLPAELPVFASWCPQKFLAEALADRLLLACTETSSSSNSSVFLFHTLPLLQPLANHSRLPRPPPDHPLSPPSQCRVSRLALHIHPQSGRIAQSPGSRKSTPRSCLIWTQFQSVFSLCCLSLLPRLHPPTFQSPIPRHLRRLHLQNTELHHHRQASLQRSRSSRLRPHRFLILHQRSTILHLCRCCLCRINRKFRLLRSSFPARLRVRRGPST